MQFQSSQEFLYILISGYANQLHLPWDTTIIPKYEMSITITNKLSEILYDKTTTLDDT